MKQETKAKVITLTTDFDDRDGFVGAMKGVILSINPSARLVDITHRVPRQDVFAGAMVLYNVCPYFPDGSIHVAVVDPGVGTDRTALTVVTERAIFVLPDNGLLSFFSRKSPILEAYAITNSEYCRPEISNTFHGRDIFAPVAAHLSLGKPPSSVGPRVRDYQRIAFPEPTVSAGEIRGQIVYRDVYGNLITNIEQGILASPPKLWLAQAGEREVPFARSYGDVAPGCTLFCVGSSGFLELAVNGGDAAAVLGMATGSAIVFRQIDTGAP